MTSRRFLVATFLGAAAWAALGLGAQASYGARMIADEPQYLLSALSLWEDRDLDIADELAAERWRPFHEGELPRQTEPRADGSELSPHDPLLPVLLAPGTGLFGWVGARVTMALVAGALAAVLVWTAVHRLGVGRRTALVVVAAFSLSAPLASYGSQVYPELVAALAVAAAAAALLGPTTGRSRWVWIATVVALPWLGVKYAPVAAALAGVGLWSLWHPPNSTKPGSRGGPHFVENEDPPNSTRSGSGGGPHLVEYGRRVAVALGVLAVAGAAYLAFHRAVYGGWTVYAAGDHFVGGELDVVGEDADHVGRTIRLLGLLVDRHFGLVAWAPVYLLVVPALAHVVARRAGRLVLGVPLAAGYATATWVALTMHGWWWPGRQVVVVLPLAVLAVAVLAERRPGALRFAVVAGALGALSWLWLVVETTFGSITLIVDFDRTSNPWIRLWRGLLPDHRAEGAAVVALSVVWALALVALAVAGWRSGRADQDAPAGEGPDADRLAVDLDRGGSVG